jgi:mono/diheme cytochrome c family protein
MRRLLFGAILLLGCDNRQAFRHLDPTFARMLTQRRADAYGGEMRAPPKGTVPRDEPDDAPPPRTRALLALGRARFETVCATCHGILGDGNSVVATKMSQRHPPSLHEPRIRADSAERIYATITEGYGVMPSHADMLEPRERWAIADYVKALQLSQNVPLSALPASDRAELAKEVP